MNVPKICILGGCGMMGRVITTCLLNLDHKTHITIADRQFPQTPFPKRVDFQKVDLLQSARLIRLLRGYNLVINSTSHHFNLPVMQAALKAGIHYLDLGGLFHYTRRQLKMASAFREKGLIAILGMGCAPGISNMLAKWAAEKIHLVQEIHIRVGGRSWGSSSEALPYAAGTIREELTLKPAVYRNGRWHFKEPQSGVEWYSFANPVGRQKVFYTIHSEIATLPLCFPTLKAASFKIGFSKEMIDTVLKSSSAANKHSSTVCCKGPIRDCEITTALVRGCTHGKRMTYIASCKALSLGNHSAGDLDTAWPPALVAQMVIQKEIQAAGVFSPEAIVPLQPFLQKLEHVGFKLSCHLS